MKNLCQKLSKNSRLKCVVGLKDATLVEIANIKIWLDMRGIPYQHKTHREDGGLKLPNNGVLILNPKKRV